jgi:DNA-binding LacI/PurR family transcriptional regulator
MGKIAAETVVKRIALESEPFPEVSVEPEPVVRASMAAPALASPDQRSSGASAVV